MSKKLKPVLYIDVDNTLIAPSWLETGYDLRPWVFSQVKVLTEFFDVRWLTCWPQEAIETLCKLVYSYETYIRTQYARWQTRMSSINKDEKLEEVLEGPPDWYWLTLLDLLQA